MVQIAVRPVGDEHRYALHAFFVVGFSIVPDMIRVS